MNILALTNAKELGEKLSIALDIELIDYETRSFPDNETYFRVYSKLENGELIIVQSAYPDPNKAFMELLLATDAAKDSGATKITAVVPYFFYARQDKRFNPGEAFSLEVISKILKSIGIGKVIVVDMHRREVGRFVISGLEFENLSAAHLLAQHVKDTLNLDAHELVLTSPDFGASKMVENAAKKVRVEFATFKKKRSSDFEVSLNGELDLEGKSVLILDDIISTGGTVLRAIDKVRASNAEKVLVAATHGIFVNDSLEKLKNSVEYLVTSDSIQTEMSKVSLAGLISEVL